MVSWVPVSYTPWLHTSTWYPLAGPDAVVPEAEIPNPCAVRSTVVLWNRRKVSTLGDQPLEGAKMTCTKSWKII